MVRGDYSIQIQLIIIININMQTLRKKTSPLKYKNETTRFLGDGVSFKAKLIGILEVSEARGDRMCQEALSDLKMAIRAAGEHKQRITINIAIDGLRLRDEKTGDSLYHHPVHKISFIAQDMTDSRAFGYIFGSPDTGHRFFGIKTDKAASQVVIAMRDLFQVVFALKKKEIELAKQHLDKSRFTSSPLFSDTSISSSKTVTQDIKTVTSENKVNVTSEVKSGGTAVADLVDLELELNSLQQGLNQMERITPSDPFASKDDPFGDSFTSYTRPILPPPPSSGKERSGRTSETSSVFSPRTPHPNSISKIDTSCGDTSLIVSRDLKNKREFNFSSDFSSSHDEPSSGDWFTPSTVCNIFEEPSLVLESTKDEKHEMTNQEILSQFDVFTELDPLGESWAIFDQNNIPPDLVKEKQAVQSEEGVSPWSSDSKEFGNGSPPDWRRGDSGSGGERWSRRRVRQDQEGWWDTSAEPEVQYYPSNRRSTDSYEEEYYECYEKPRRRKQTGYIHGSQAAGGHSSSSRDVSPWEEEPRRREIREQRTGFPKHAKPYTFEKHRDRRRTGSWDDEDDYEYEEEHTTSRFHRSDRPSREVDRERYKVSGREHDVDRWRDDWNDERRYRRRRESERDRRCCPDWDHNEHEKPTGRYGGGRWSHIDVPSGMRRDWKHDERYYSRESQESPWDDDHYSNEADEVLSSHYLTAKRIWKRPSSASEMDRTTGDLKSRHYISTGGSDGERDRRYKLGRRSRSRDSQCSELSNTDVVTSLRPAHRSKQYLKSQFDDFTEIPSKKQADISKLDCINKKSLTLASRKKSKEGPKSEEHVVSTFSRKPLSLAKSLFENDFVSSENCIHVKAKINLENDLETSESESPTPFNKCTRGQLDILEKSTSESQFAKENYRQKSLRELKLSPRLQNKSKSLFEDDFSPLDKPETLPEDNSISSIKEETGRNEAEDSFSTNNFENTTNSRKKKFSKHRLANNFQPDATIKKSESVNIFARESDPFDDDFFSENLVGAPSLQYSASSSPRTTDLKWTDDFEDINVEEKK